MIKITTAKQCNQGFTLIETIIYIVLLSFLLAGFIQYAYETHTRNMKLNHEIYSRGQTSWRQNGFIAVIAVILLATGTLAFSLVTMASAISSAESVNLKELRIQTELNAQACLDHVTLMTVKDYFMAGDFEINEFDCTAKVTNDLNGNVNLEVKAKLDKVVTSHMRNLTIGDDKIETIDIF